jgi:hypothetical protein
MELSSQSRTKTTSSRRTSNRRVLRIPARDRSRLAVLNEVLCTLPVLDGPPIGVEIRPEIHVASGRLILHGNGDQAVHGAANIRRRKILLEAALLDDLTNLKRIFLHELFHFAWVRLSNGKRLEYEGILHRELDSGARGELGWSAEMRKNQISAADVKKRSRRWREYICESFCDTAAWWFGESGDHPEHTLSRRYHPGRRAWYRNFMPAGGRIAL